MAASEIEWTESTWNPIAGCTVISPGCTNCYAMRMAARLEAMANVKYEGTTRRSGGRAVWSGRTNFDAKTVKAPLEWTRPRRIFVNSMSDLFHKGVSDGVIQSIWSVMEMASWHSFQVLTKRPERMRYLVSHDYLKPLPNVWLGTSVENADYFERIDEVRATPAAIRFISFEPLLGPIGDVNLKGIDWAIVGGESGPHARPMKQEWVDQIHTACRVSGVPFFFKQWGGTRKKRTGRQLYGRTYDEYPNKDLRAQVTA